MYLKKTILCLAVCLMLLAIPALAETYVCNEQGFSIEYDPAYTAQWEDNNGVVIYTKTPDSIPYAIAWRIDTDDVAAYSTEDFFAWLTNDLHESYADRLLSLEEGISVKFDGIQVPGIRCVYELQGHEVEMLCFLHKADDSVRKFTVKYLRDDPEFANRTMEALATLMRSFALTSNTASAPSTNVDNTASISSDAIFNCEQQGFSFAYDPMYTVQWEENCGVVLYAEEVGVKPYVIVERLGKGAMPNFDADAYFRYNIKQAQDSYGDALISIEEGLTLTLGDLQLPGVRLVCENSNVVINGQTQKTEMMVFIHEMADAVCCYTASYDPGEGEQLLAAMAKAIQSFSAREIPATYETFTCEAQGFSIEIDSAYSAEYEDGKRVIIYTEEPGTIPYATVCCLATGDISGYDIDASLAAHAQNMRESYGEQLSVAEEITIEVSGGMVKGMHYIYKNDQGYSIERCIFLQKSADALQQYEVRTSEGMIDDTLAAMIHAAESFSLLRSSTTDVLSAGLSGVLKDTSGE